MTPPRRVVVTGIGMVTPLGNSLASTVAAIHSGLSAIRPVTSFDATGFIESEGGEVRGFTPRDHFRVPKAIKLTDRAAQLAVAAAAMALDDAGWPREESALDGLGVAIGSSGSDLQARDLARAIGADAERRAVRDTAFFAERVLSGLNPLWLLVNLPNMTSAHVAIQLSARGPNTTIMTDWVAGMQAIGEAFEWVRCGETDAVLAGGADCGVYPFAYASYEQGGMFDPPTPASGAPITHPNTTRFVPAEGAAVCLVEEREHARRRGGRVYGELRAYASASAPVGEGDATEGALARTIQQVMNESGWTADDVGAIGTASVFRAPFARMEQLALQSVLGPAASAIHQIEVKTRMGHALAASGPIDFGLLLALCGGRREPTGLLCNSLGYSGQAATLAATADVFRRNDGGSIFG